MSMTSCDINFQMSGNSVAWTYKLGNCKRKPSMLNTWYENKKRLMQKYEKPRKSFSLSIINSKYRQFLMSVAIVSVKMSVYCNDVNQGLLKVTYIKKNQYTVQSNSVITNSMGPAEFVRYNRGSL